MAESGLEYIGDLLEDTVQALFAIALFCRHGHGLFAAFMLSRLPSLLLESQGFWRADSLLG